MSIWERMFEFVPIYGAYFQYARFLEEREGVVDRKFPFERIEVNGTVVNGQKIECAKCPTIEYFPQTSHGKVAAPEATKRYFERRGWVVGSVSRKDVCPSCGKKARRAKLKVVTSEETKANTPREMTRDERRILMAKLEDVYGKDAYIPPWTDAAVANDLGVPRKWVEDTRQEFFGDAGENPDIQKFLEESAPIITQTKNLFNSARAQLEQARELVDSAKKLQVQQDMIEKRITYLEALARRIERGSI